MHIVLINYAEKIMSLSSVFSAGNDLDKSALIALVKSADQSRYHNVSSLFQSIPHLFHLIAR